MISNLDKAIEFVLKWEGGYSFDKNDPGGETKYGISKRAFPNLDIKNLSLEKAKEIYKEYYWDKCYCDTLPTPMDIVVFDTAVNMGVSKALSLFDTNKNVVDYLFTRINFYIKISHKTKDRYLRGWINRVVDLYSTVR